MVKVRLDLIKINQLENIQYSEPNQKKRIKEFSESYQQTGTFEPIKLNSDYSIIDGHTRYFAAKKLGLTDIEAIFI